MPFRPSFRLVWECRNLAECLVMPTRGSPIVRGKVTLLAEGEPVPQEAHVRLWVASGAVCRMGLDRSRAIEGRF